MFSMSPRGEHVFLYGKTRIKNNASRVKRFETCLHAITLTARPFTGAVSSGDGRF